MRKCACGWQGHQKRDCSVADSRRASNCSCTQRIPGPIQFGSVPLALAARTAAIRSRCSSTTLGRPTPRSSAVSTSLGSEIRGSWTIRFTLRSGIPGLRRDWPLRHGRRMQYLHSMSGHGSDHPPSPPGAVALPRSLGPAGYRSPSRAIFSENRGVSSGTTPRSGDVNAVDPRLAARSVPDPPCELVGPLLDCAGSSTAPGFYQPPRRGSWVGARSSSPAQLPAASPPRRSPECHSCSGPCAGQTRPFFFFFFRSG